VGSASFWIKLTLLVVLAARCDRDSRYQNGIHLSGSRLYYHAVPIEIQNDALYSLGRNNLTWSCVSKRHVWIRTDQTDREMPSIFQPLSVLDKRGEDKSPKLPVGLLSVIAGSTARAVMFAVLRERYAF